MKPSQIAGLIAAAVAAVAVWRAQQPQPPTPEQGDWEPAANLGNGR